MNFWPSLPHLLRPRIGQMARAEYDGRDVATEESLAPPIAPEAEPRRAIRAIDIVKEFETEIGIRRVLNGISFDVASGERLAILGRNGAGKSTLIQILSGLQIATSGTVERGLRMSWPLALAGGFEGELTGYDNIRFITRIYDVPFRETYAFIEDFTELGQQLHIPVRYYSSGMTMRLAFALSLSLIHI